MGPISYPELVVPYSRRSEGKTCTLLRLEDVVPVQIEPGPDDRNYEKGDEARPVVD